MFCFTEHFTNFQERFSSELKDTSGICLKNYVNIFPKEGMTNYSNKVTSIDMLRMKYPLYKYNMN